MSSFSRESTAEEVVDGLDLSGQFFMITGTTSGLGEESAPGAGCSRSPNSDAGPE